MGTIALKLLTVAGYAWLYAVGGRPWPGKWVRRWIATPIMILALFWFSRETLNPMKVAIIPLFFCTCIFGYGGDDLEKKISRRLLFGAMFSAYALILGWAFGSLLEASFSAVLAIVTSFFFGVLNPDDKAAEEETVIAGLSTFLLPFLVS